MRIDNSASPFFSRAVLVATLLLAAIPAAAQGPTFTVRSSPSVLDESVDGRIILILTTRQEPEPRFQVSPGPNAPLIFGIDVNGMAPGDAAQFDASVFGFPISSLDSVPSGDYWIQAVLHRYETFNLATGHSVKLPMNRGAGQNWRRAPGNLFSTPRRIRLEADTAQTIVLELDNMNPPIDSPRDSKYVRHVRIQSKLLTEFWGRPMYLGAHVLVPEGFDDHPEARYPLMVFHGHFPADFGGFRTEPPDPDLECTYSSRFQVDCYNRIVQEEAYDFYQRWIAPSFPRFLIIKIQHANPYYDDSYAVNSANLGPYGDAINDELIPHIEARFRGLGEGWARFTYGGSTGGWEALATQVFYPERYNGTFAACPDPIDFRAYTLVNIYDHDNAYWVDSEFKRVPIPGHRNWLGWVDTTLEEYNLYELVLGTSGRSGDQWDIWQAVYSPQGQDGYPEPIWDKRTGDIDHDVAAYWRENYDLRYIMERDWDRLGAQLEGKLHIYCGDMDNYYLNNAVYLTERFLERTTKPHYGGVVDYGDRAEHCWNGDHENPNHISRLRYNTMYLPIIMDRIERTAPAGADLTSWRY